ncbi:3-oxoacyl-(acyl-carrier-protein) synthase III [Nocardioides thalensis]|uniref:Beta-ketoacyl-[acyl-carrier-protein] synthase III n=1 Tax=Nocardioides thalensis TaxID=1914755 RepID=A0A853C1E4_9ACTN|nr:beta-ketoacyl-ACP synthase III [Nocardioides thalensis]NYJ00967.1 3-oxoacyl-(acyl-carrier-protein) synthase III [Nocardioides thalensis]
MSEPGLLGVGSYRPARIVPNSEIVDAIDSTDEWIQQRSGIRERRIAGPDESVVSMGTAAARTAVERAGLDPQQVDCVIVATVSHPLATPSAAARIAFELGTDQAAAFDVSAACAGFCHGVAVAADLVRGGSARHVVVIGVEKLSDITDPHDRGTAFIFADGAGAVVVGPTESAGIGPVVWGSDGEQYDLIRSIGPGEPTLTMQGREVFRWASYSMAKVALQALDRAGVGLDELDLFVPHQANNRITDAMARAMSLPDTVRIARDIVDAGNTSAASIPLALDRMIADGDARPGDRALLVAFGAGLSYAAQVVTLP